MPPEDMPVRLSRVWVDDELQPGSVSRVRSSIMVDIRAKQKAVLLVTHDFAFTVVLRRAFREVGVLDHVSVVTDGVEAMAHLRNHPAEQFLLLVDLEMPASHAFSFLRELGQDDTLRMIPLVVLAASNDKAGIAQCYSFGVAGYVVKSHDCAKMVEKVRGICSYWALSRLPAVV
jgi:CheY-like chemotaxis protein